MKRTQLKQWILPVAMSALASPSSLSAWHSCSHDSETQSNNIVFGTIGAIAAGVGLWAFGSYMEWWNGPTNAELVERGRQSIADASSYQVVCRAVQVQFQEIYKMHQGSSYGYEQVLYECATLKRHSASISSYLASMNTVVGNLRHIGEKLYRRINDIERKDALRYQADLALLRSVRYEVQRVHDELAAVYAYLYEHRGYFKLFEAEDTLTQEYARELSLVYQYPYNDYELLFAARSALTARRGELFGLIYAVRTLQSDTSSLERALNSVSYAYSNRIECARALLYALKRVQEVVIASPDYAQLVIQYEAAERDKERLRLERERVANERRIAAAKEREVCAREREARAQEEHNRLKAHENHLKQQELYDNRMQQYNCHC